MAALIANANAGDLNAPEYRPPHAAPVYERSPDRERYDRAVPPVYRQTDQRLGLIEPNAPTPGSRLILLGQKLFYDGRLSRTGLTACATCHDPHYAFAQPTRVSQSDTGQLGLRNAPSLINAGVLPVLMWDGRFRTLEQQATSPFLRGEMGIDIREAERRLNSDAEYLHMFQAALSSRPSASGMARALAAYQRTLISETSRFDRFISNNKAANLTSLELDGLLLFERKAGCSICHQLEPSGNYQTSGLRLFTDFGFHNLGIGYAAGRFADTGRYRASGDESDLGAFRTPSLRNVAVTAPYMHDGSLATLEDVIDFYDAGGRPNPNLSPFIRPLFLSAYEKAALIAFLRTLTDQQYDRTPLREMPAVSYRPNVSRGHRSDLER
jgi:cytochrome c peroxidase